MATITNAVLSIIHNREKKIAEITVKCQINFTHIEQCQMRTCKGTWFKLRCQLLATEPIIPWIEVTSLQVVNKILYSLPAVHYFPDTTPTATESKEFTATVGENLLDTDLGVDEIYAKLILSNLNTTVSITKNTNVVRHSF